MYARDERAHESLHYRPFTTAEDGEGEVADGAAGLDAGVDAPQRNVACA